jgi:hypothetical protein
MGTKPLFGSLLAIALVCGGLNSTSAQPPHRAPQAAPGGGPQGAARKPLGKAQAGKAQAGNANAGNQQPGKPKPGNRPVQGNAALADPGVQMLLGQFDANRNNVLDGEELVRLAAMLQQMINARRQQAGGLGAGMQGAAGQAHALRQQQQLRQQQALRQGAGQGASRGANHGGFQAGGGGAGAGRGGGGGRR